MKSNLQDVLFQKIGNTWYIFTEVNGEVEFSPLPVGVNPIKDDVEIHSVIEQAKRSASSNRKQYPEQAA